MRGQECDPKLWRAPLLARNLRGPRRRPSRQRTRSAFYNKFPLQKSSQQEDGWLFFIPDSKTHNYHDPEGYAVFFLLLSSCDHVAPTSQKFALARNTCFPKNFCSWHRSLPNDKSSVCWRSRTWLVTRPFPNQLVRNTGTKNYRPSQLPNK